MKSSTRDAHPQITGQARNDRFGRITCFGDRRPSHLINGAHCHILICCQIAISLTESAASAARKDSVSAAFCVHDNSFRMDLAHSTIVGLIQHILHRYIRGNVWAAACQWLRAKMEDDDLADIALFRMVYVTDKSFQHFLHLFERQQFFNTIRRVVGHSASTLSLSHFWRCTSFAFANKIGFSV
jgi:hypothetical protein